MAIVQRTKQQDCVCVCVWCFVWNVWVDQGLDGIGLASDLSPPQMWNNTPTIGKGSVSHSKAKIKRTRERSPNCRYHYLALSPDLVTYFEWGGSFLLLVTMMCQVIKKETFWLFFLVQIFSNMMRYPWIIKHKLYFPCYLVVRTTQLENARTTVKIFSTMMWSSSKSTGIQLFLWVIKQ